MFIYVRVCSVCEGTCGSRKMGWPGIPLMIVVSPAVWMLRIQLRLSGRAQSQLLSQFPSPQYLNPLSN